MANKLFLMNLDSEYPSDSFTVAQAIEVYLTSGRKKKPLSADNAVRKELALGIREGYLVRPTRGVYRLAGGASLLIGDELWREHNA